MRCRSGVSRTFKHSPLPQHDRPENVMTLVTFKGQTGVMQCCARTFQPGREKHRDYCMELCDLDLARFKDEVAQSSVWQQRRLEIVRASQPARSCFAGRGTAGMNH